MKTTEEVIRYEDAAEQCTVTGWRCLKCRRFYGDDEHMARWCCGNKDQPCECGGRIHGSYVRCQACQDKARDEQWAKIPKVEWDGESPVCVFDDDKYFFGGAEEVLYWLDDREIKVEDARLVICEQASLREFEICEFLSDDLPEDGADFSGADIDKIVNDWIAANVRPLWYPTGNAVSVESLKIHIGDRP